MAGLGNQDHRWGQDWAVGTVGRTCPSCQEASQFSSIQAPFGRAVERPLGSTPTEEAYVLEWACVAGPPGDCSCGRREHPTLCIGYAARLAQGCGLGFTSLVICKFFCNLTSSFNFC